jgi:hypothetical protein
MMGQCQRVETDISQPAAVVDGLQAASPQDGSALEENDSLPQ